MDTVFINSIVNANDNLDDYWLSVVPLEEHTKLIAQVSTANYIIEKHCTHWWKNNPHSYEFMQSQLWLCSTLINADVHGTFIYGLLASGLGCGAIALMNDPELKHIAFKTS